MVNVFSCSTLINQRTNYNYHKILLLRRTIQKKMHALSKTVFFSGLVMRNFTDHGNVFLSSTVNKIIVILRAYVITKKNTKEKISN